MNKVRGFLRTMNKVQNTKLKRLSKPLSSIRVAFSNATRNRFDEIKKTLTEVAKQLSTSGAAKSCDGSKQSAIGSYLMIQTRRGCETV